MSKRRLLVVAFAFFLAVGLFAEPVDPAAENRIVSIGIAGVDFAPTIVAREILTEAYVSIGYRAEFVPFPPNRMIKQLVSGKIDAMLIAEVRVSDDNPGIIRIETPVWKDELVAFSRKGIVVRGWESLRPYRIGYIEAMLIIEQRLSNGFTRAPVQGPDQLFRMLDKGRVDVVVTSRSIGRHMIAKMGLTGIAPAGDTLETVLNYHFLAKDREEMSRSLSKALAEMEKAGRIAKITQETLARL